MAANDNVALPMGEGYADAILFPNYEINLKLSKLEESVAEVLLSRADPPASPVEGGVYGVVGMVIVLLTRDLVSRLAKWVKSHWQPIKANTEKS